MKFFFAFDQRTVRFIALWLVTSAAAPALAQGAQLFYSLDLTDKPDGARASLRIEQDSAAIRELSFTGDDARFVEFSTDGDDEALQRADDRMVWRVPQNGGTLTWRAPVTHVRANDAIDAKLGERWALFRAEDVFFSVASRAAKNTEVSATLDVRLPDGWSFLSAMPHGDNGYEIEDTSRRVDRPAGWMIAGELGVRIDRIAGVRATVAAARGQNFRRQDILALLNWVMPDLVRLLPDYPAELLIVGAEDPFWRGGLSGPGSLYLHADRPLISENGTSTLVHELFHVGLRRSGGDEDDWIIEGLAEYYSVQLLRRSGTTTASRYNKTMRSLARYGEKAGDRRRRDAAPKPSDESSAPASKHRYAVLRGARSRGAVTAFAVGVFAELDAEIRRASDKSLDDVVRVLSERDDDLSLDELRDVVKDVAGAPSKVLAQIS